jgi:hypothetical protein
MLTFAISAAKIRRQTKVAAMAVAAGAVAVKAAVVLEAVVVGRSKEFSLIFNLR